MPGRRAAAPLQSPLQQCPGIGPPGLLDDIHYIRAQWHLADGQTNAEDIAHNEDKPKKAEKKGPSKDDNRPDWWREVPPEDAGVQVRAHGYESIESLVRWQLRENLSGGLLMELGQHLFDAAAMFMAATPNRDQQTAYPLSVAASAGRLRPDAEGDLDDHVYCVFEYPVAGYLAEGPRKTRKKIGLQYDLIIGNQFDGYGETVLGKQGSLVLDRQQRGLLYHTSDTDKRIRVVEKKAGKGGPSHVALEVPKEHPQASDDEAAAIGQMALVGRRPRFRRGTGALGLVRPQSQRQAARRRRGRAGLDRHCRSRRKGRQERQPDRL